MGAEGGTSGWKKSNITAEQYLKLLKDYQAEIEKDPYVWGATVFGASPTPDWDAFNVDEFNFSWTYGAPTHIEQDWEYNLKSEELNMATLEALATENGGTWPKNDSTDITSIGTGTRKIRMAYLNTKEDRIVFERSGYATILRGDQSPN